MTVENSNRKNSVVKAVAKSIANETASSTKRLNQMRLATVGAFFVIQLIGGVILKQPDLQMNSWLFGVYGAFALVLYILGRNYNQWLSALAYAVPVIDMPMCLLILWSAAGSGSARGTAGFGAGIFALMIVISSLGLKRKVIVISAISAAICEDWLQSMVGVSGPARMASTCLMALVAAGCVFMVKRLKELTSDIASEQVQRERMSRYFSPQVSELLESDRPEAGQSNNRTITVLFCDIKGFTAMTEQLGGQQIVELLNAHFTAMVDVVFEHGATLDKFMGDALLAYFGAPLPSEDHADRALACAVAMQKRVVALNKSLEKTKLPQLQIAIAVHTGTAVLGNIGSDKRKEFTAIGEAVNTTARMESLAKEQGAAILVSQSSKEQTTHHYEFIELPPKKLRGISEPLVCYSLEWATSE